MTVLPRLVVAAPASGQGKTTVATGLMAALARAGHVVSGHKVGPDYIDPGFHALACGRPGRNLDPHLVGEDRVVPLLLHGARSADVAVLEGVMGLYDGRVGADGYASTAHVAALTDSPVLLVVDASAASRTVAAVVHGVATFDPSLRVGGVVLNKVGSRRHAAEITSALQRTQIPVLGALPRDAGLAAPARHLGLVPAAERAETAALVERLGERVAEHIDLDAVLALAGSASALEAEPWDPAAEMRVAGEGRPVVAVAGGRAFTFRYAETEELLRAAGCEVVAFDPATDPALPEGTAGIYLGGGFPEVHAEALTGNEPLRRSLRDAVAAGVPTVAECAGLLYLSRTLDGSPMVGAVGADAAMAERLTLAYPTATSPGDTLLTRAGETVTGHEFHRTQVTPGAGDGELGPAWTAEGRTVGFASGTLHASYLHVHWAGHPHLAQRFADAVHARAERSPIPAETSPKVSGTSDDLSSRAEQATSRPVEPLRHHGDVEVRGQGVADFAVNVYAGPRPPWLDDAIHAGLGGVAAYPDATSAEEALAALHARRPEEVLATAGAAEAFSLLARLRRWRRPVVVHPQFTEPHAALEQAGCGVSVVACRAEDGFVLDPAAVPDDADLVVVGNPTNPTGVLHPHATLDRLRRPGRLVVVDEAFMDTVPGEPETLADSVDDGLVVIRSLTKHWSIAGLRAGYLLGSAAVVADLRRGQTPWSVSTPALAAMTALATPTATTESRARAERLVAWRSALEAGLTARRIPHVASATSFVLARPGHGAHAALRDRGVAVRRADTFPGLDGSWVRIAVRPPATTALLFSALDDLLDDLHHQPHHARGEA
ncbi:cobyrinate a,c-diamide synthase [Nocardioides sp. DS6]|uniref:Hydrogenobyrinate a,c-diamide synthase n=1 Tax=Nocardioides eburneus TaxID=3231482 RepID=A0ABV3T1N4_9ACTN